MFILNVDVVGYTSSGCPGERTYPSHIKRCRASKTDPRFIFDLPSHFISFSFSVFIWFFVSFSKQSENENEQQKTKTKRTEMDQYLRWHRFLLNLNILGMRQQTQKLTRTNLRANKVVGGAKSRPRMRRARFARLGTDERTDGRTDGRRPASGRRPAAGGRKDGRTDRRTYSWHTWMQFESRNNKTKQTTSRRSNVQMCVQFEPSSTSNVRYVLMFDWFKGSSI